MIQILAYLRIHLKLEELEKNFTYIKTNIPGPGCNLNDFEEDFIGCECSDGEVTCTDQSDNEFTNQSDAGNCSITTCSCIDQFGRSYEGDHLIVEDGVIEDAVLRKPVLECGVNCACDARKEDDKGTATDPSNLTTCSNHVVASGIKFEFSIFQTDSKGFGLKTLTDIPIGSFVCEYAGEAIGKMEAGQRIKLKKHDHQKINEQLHTDHEQPNKKQKQTNDQNFIETERATMRVATNKKDEQLTKDNPTKSMNYIIALQEHIGTSSTNIDSESSRHTYIVDAEYYSNIGHFINHCCDPNLVMIPVRSSFNFPRLALFARRSIKRFEELTFHYGGLDKGGNIHADGGGGGADDDDDEELVMCTCGSDNCNGQLPFHSGLFS